MFNGYKAVAWNDYERHIYVPSTKSFSAVLNYDMPAILILGGLSLATLITGIIISFSTGPAGLILMLVGSLTVALLLLGYRGGRIMDRTDYNNWLIVEKAYWEMSGVDRKRHRKTLTRAFNDEEVRDIAEKIFKVLKVEKDLSSLKAELEDLRVKE